MKLQVHLASGLLDFTNLKRLFFEGRIDTNFYTRDEIRDYIFYVRSSNVDYAGVVTEPKALPSKETQIFGKSFIRHYSDDFDGLSKQLVFSLENLERDFPDKCNTRTHMIKSLNDLDELSINFMCDYNREQALIRIAPRTYVLCAPEELCLLVSGLSRLEHNTDYNLLGIYYRHIGFKFLKFEKNCFKDIGKRFYGL